MLPVHLRDYRRAEIATLTQVFSSDLDQGDPSGLPRHLGIMMDGNGRWAKRRGLLRLAGHRQGTQNVRRVLLACRDHGIRVVSLYVFSTENWGRPRDEVEGFFGILGEVIDQEVPKFREQGVQLRHSGSLDGVPSSLATKVRQAVELTRENRDYILNVAFNYGGRADILRAVRGVLDAGVPPSELDEAMFRRHLYTDGLPDIDLVIRTGGEQRLSNFFLWQSAQAYFFVSPVPWPDFDEQELGTALDAYRRQVTGEG